MLKRTFALLIFCCGSLISAQQKDSLLLKNGIDKPSILSTHHFGIFSARINQNFKIAPPKNIMIELSSVSGNTFHPFVETYLPKDPKVREEQSKLIWHDRNFNFIDQESTPADYMNIVIDAVIKEFRINAIFPINKNHEFGISLRSYLITSGRYPLTLFTSDESIEWFHSNISGGEDPYGRRYYGLNQVHFKYTDRNGHILELKNRDFFISGVELNHYYYPTSLNNKKKNLFFNFGTHLGINTSIHNKSLDLGFSANTIKKLTLKNSNELHFAFGTSILRKNLINNNDVIDLGNNPYLAAIESEIEYTKYTKDKNYNSLGINYQIQSRYNKLKEADYYRLIGKWQEINGGWQHGVTTLYKALSNWTILYTYGRPKLKITIYLKEDFLVNNAPDIQTGISLNFPILN
ncbi:MAG TPA: hypothetical protein VIS27_08505 [Yeosuana sp.]